MDTDSSDLISFLESLTMCEVFSYIKSGTVIHIIIYAKHVPELKAYIELNKDRLPRINILPADVCYVDITTLGGSILSVVPHEDMIIKNGISK